MRQHGWSATGRKQLVSAGVLAAIAIAGTGCASGSSSGGRPQASATASAGGTADTGETTSAAGGTSSDASGNQPKDPSFVSAAIPVDTAPTEVAAGFGSVWVVTHRGATTERIDPATNKVIARVSSPGVELIGIAIGAGRVWYLDSINKQLEGIDPATNKIADKIKVHSDGGSLWSAFGSVWFGGTTGQLWRISAGGKVQQIRIARTPSPLGVGGSAKWIWVADSDNHTLYRVDPHTNRAAGKTILQRHRRRRTRSWWIVGRCFQRPAV